MYMCIQSHEKNKQNMCKNTIGWYIGVPGLIKAVLLYAMARQCGTALKWLNPIQYIFYMYAGK